jgi:DNA-binding NarL/FixJ family response regulator
MRKIKILIADDHPIVREGLASMLRNEGGFEVMGEAENGQEAINKTLEMSPDVVLMDLRMPGIDGVEAMRKIGAQNKNIKFVVLTTYDNDDYLFKGIEAGAKAYLIKDSPRNEIFNAIRAVFEGESIIPPKIATRVLDRFAEISHEFQNSPAFSDREMEILGLISKGLANKDIAAKMFVSESTVKTYIQSIFHKLGVNDRAQAVMEAIKRGILHP